MNVDTMKELWNGLISNQPAPLVQWGTFALALILAFFKAWGFFWDRRDRTRDQNIQFADAWFKVVVFNDALPVLAAFLQKNRASFAEPPIPPQGQNITRYQAFLSDLAKESEQIKSRVQVVQLVSKHAYQNLVTYIEELGDIITRSCYKLDGMSDEATRASVIMEVSGAFDSFHQDCLATLRAVHRALYDQKSPDKVIEIKSP